MTPDDNIKLTPTELEEIKDDVRFKTKTSEDLKLLKTYCRNLENVKTDISVLKSKINTNWKLIMMILIAIVGLSFTVFTQ